MKSRRNFLKDVCPTLAFAFFGLSFLEACSSGDDDVATTYSDTGSDTGSGADLGYTKDGNTYAIDLNNSNFSAIGNVGGWMNGKGVGIPALFLRISSNKIQAYTNVCPHQGHTGWTYNNNIFKCSRHGREYSDDCNSALTCYNPELSGDTLTLTI